MPASNYRITDELLSLLRRHNVSHSELARAMDFHRVTVVRVMTRRSNPSAAFVAAFLEVFPHAEPATMFTQIPAYKLIRVL